MEDGNISTFSPRSQVFHKETFSKRNDVIPLQGGTTSTVSNASALRNALDDLDDDDEEPPLGQATPLQLEAQLGAEVEPLEELGRVGCQLGPSSPAGNFTLGGVSSVVIDEVGVDFFTSLFFGQYGPRFN